MSKKKVRFMCTAFRDGFQSVYGARVFTPDFLPAVAAAKSAGIEYFEAGGGARFQSLYFYCDEDAFAMMDAFRDATGPDTSLQTLSRGVNVVGLESQPSDIVKLHADLFKNAHGLVVNALDLLLIQRFDNRQVAGEGPQHGVSTLGAGAAAGLTAPALAWTGYAHDQVLSDWKGFGKWKNHPAPLSSAKVTAK